MDHVAIMKKSWGLLPKIISGEKTCEARWYKIRRTPWNVVHKGDNVYFKNGSEPVTAMAIVSNVYQYEVRDNAHTLEIMKERALSDLGTNEISEDILKYITNKGYAIFIYFDKVKKVKPFKIDKRGFGSMTAWISINNIDKIKL